MLTPIPAANHAIVPPTNTHPTNHAHTNQTRSPNHPSADLTVTTYHPANATYPQPTHPWQDPDHASAGPTNGVGNSLTGQAAGAPTADSSQPNADTEPSMNAYVPNRRLPSTPFTAPTQATANAPTTVPFAHLPQPATPTYLPTTPSQPTAPPRRANPHAHKGLHRRRGHPSPQPRQHPTTTRHAASKHENAGFWGAGRRATRVGNFLRVDVPARIRYGFFWIDSLWLEFGVSRAEIDQSGAVPTGGISHITAGRNCWKTAEKSMQIASANISWGVG